MRKNEEDQGMKLLRCGGEVLLGSGLAFGCCLLLLFLAAVGISKGLLSAALRDQLVVVACVVGSFAGGLLAAARCQGKGLIVGAAVGGVLFLLQMTAGILLFSDHSLENGGIGLLCGDLFGGAAAGILGGGGRRSAPKRKRRRGR